MFLKKSLIGVCLIFYSAFGYCGLSCSSYAKSVKLPPLLYPGVTYPVGDLFECWNDVYIYGGTIEGRQYSRDDLYINPLFKAADVAIGSSYWRNWTVNNYITESYPQRTTVMNWYADSSGGVFLFRDFKITMPKSIKQPFSLKAGENLIRLNLRSYIGDHFGDGREPVPVGYDGSRITVYINAQSDSKFVSCDYSKSNVAVKLPAVNKSTFSKIGVVAANTQFNLGYSCSDAVISSVQLDGTADATAGKTVLASQTGTGYASGVGIQFVDDQGAVIELGKPYPFSSSSLIANQQFSARYYQTKSAVTPGLVKGTATVTYTFQ